MTFVYLSSPKILTVVDEENKVVWFIGGETD